MKVTVPQPEGTIALTTNGADFRSYEVKDGEVDVNDEHVNHFLENVPGSAVKTKGKSADPAA